MLSIGIYWDRIRESEAPKIHVMGLGPGDRKEKRNTVEVRKKNLDTPQFKLTSLIHCIVMELHQDKPKKMKQDIGKATDTDFGVGMQRAS